MLKKIMIALVALAAIGGAVVPTGAQARGWRGGRGFYRGGFYRGYRGWGLGPRWGYRGYYPAYGAYGCWRTVRVFTPWGPRWRRMWVC